MAGLFDLAGKTVVVTGATRGIGQSMTLGLAELGADIISLQVENVPALHNIPRLTMIQRTERPEQRRDTAKSPITRPKFQFDTV